MANVAKIAKGIVKAATKSKKPSLKAAQKAKPLANPKSGVKVKPTAKQKPNKPDSAKTMFKNDSSRTRASDKAMKEFELDVRYETGGRPTDPSYASKLGERVAMNTKLKRKPNLNIKKK
jgi:hypothetical protein